MQHYSPIVAPTRSAARRGDTTKVILITLVVIFGLMILVCAGVGVGGYLWFKQNLGQAFVNDPAVIQQMTTEIADISLPPEFAPYSGTRIFGVTILMYRYCPEGNCPPAQGFDAENDIDADAAGDSESVDFETYDLLTLSSYGKQDDEMVAVEDPEELEQQHSEEGLKERYNNATVEKKVLTIKGRECTFYIVQGEEIDWTQVEDQKVAMADDGEEMVVQEETVTTLAEPAPAEPAAETPPADVDPAAPAETPAAPQPGRKVVEVQGIFPGKTNDVTLRLYMSAEKYDPAKVQQLLESIK